ncbi:MAG TPA: hypothetical protein VIY73_17200 [Polyangiaceae bacterium]
MKAHRTDCCQRTKTRRGGWAAGGVVFTILAALMPKCPLCIAAMLGVLGLTGLTGFAAHVDLRLLWVAAALALAAGSALLVHRFLDRKETPS